MKTEVQFTNGKDSGASSIQRQLHLLGNCMQFKGWADTSMACASTRPARRWYGQVDVEGVNLEGWNPVANNFVTVLCAMQSTNALIH